MATYLILNLVFVAACAIAVLCGGPRHISLRHIGITIGVLCLLTAVFDSLIVANGIVAYDEAKILGLRIGDAPIEDFAYAVIAGLCVPIIFEKLGRTDAE
jgi:lycopene cyclase domain-containing protein